MYSFDDTLRKIETGITKFRFNEHPRSLYDPIEYILGLGGKRIRPVLTLLACNLFSDNVDQAVKPALGLEVFHNFTLLHDDLMDQADKRRNKPTVHKVWDQHCHFIRRRDDDLCVPACLRNARKMLKASYGPVFENSHGNM